MGNRNPTVSIGLPVFNGENYLALAIRSVLEQSFGDFELIISDNASTDGTEDLAREFARADRRIRYKRLGRNLGPAKNFNRLPHLARGRYFQWISHDDVWAPSLLEELVPHLDSDESVVLSHSRVTLIDENGEEIRPVVIERMTESPLPHERLESLLFERVCHQIFGLIRMTALEKTPLLGAYAHGDGVLLIRLALQGRFHEVPKHLFFYREHSEQSIVIARTRYDEYTAWFDPSKKGQLFLPWWRIAGEVGKSLILPPPKGTSLRKNLRVYLRWLGTRRSLLKADLRGAASKIWHAEQRPVRG